MHCSLSSSRRLIIVGPPPDLHISARRHALSKFTMPAMSPTMTEGGIASWKKKEGESYQSGDVLLEIPLCENVRGVFLLLEDIFEPGAACQRKMRRSYNKRTLAVTVSPWRRILRKGGSPPPAPAWRGSSALRRSFARSDRRCRAPRSRRR